MQMKYIDKEKDVAFIVPVWKMENAKVFHKWDNAAILNHMHLENDDYVSRIDFHSMDGLEELLLHCVDKEMSSYLFGWMVGELENGKILTQENILNERRGKGIIRGHIILQSPKFTKEYITNSFGINKGEQRGTKRK